MNSTRWYPQQVFIYSHPVDMRKQIQGLANIVSIHLDRDPGDESLYVFVNKRRDKIKLLIWDGSVRFSVSILLFYTERIEPCQRNSILIRL